MIEYFGFGLTCSMIGVGFGFFFGIGFERARNASYQRSIRYKGPQTSEEPVFIPFHNGPREWR